MGEISKRALDGVLEIAKEIDEEVVVEDSDLVTLSNGVVLKTKLVPYKLITRLDKKYKLPPVPVIEDEERGRKIPNPDDPAYEEECRLVQEEKGMAMLELLTGFGTELVSVPNDIYRPEDTEWADDLSSFLDEDEAIAESGKARYVAWLTYYVLLDPNDINKVSEKIKNKMGVSVQGVAEAIERFPDNEERGTNTRN
jgi:hypothetical protein